MFGSYLQEIPFDEITLESDDWAPALITESLDARPALDPRLDSTKNAEGRPWRAYGTGWPSLWEVFGHLCGMSVCTLVLLCPFRDHGFFLNTGLSPPCPEELILGRC